MAHELMSVCVLQEISHFGSVSERRVWLTGELLGKLGLQAGVGGRLG